MTAALRWGVLCVACVAAWASAGPAATAQFVAPEGSDYHNGATLPLEDVGPGRELLARLQAELDRADAEGVAAELRALRALDATALVAFGPRTHVAALDLAARLVVQKGAEAVLERVRADLDAARAEALRRRDVDALLDLATRGAELPGAAACALAAARLRFERGEFWEAAVLAGRATGQPGAAELAAAARAHLDDATGAATGAATGDADGGASSGARALPAAPSGGPAPGDWELEGGLKIRMLIDRGGGVTLPWAGDGLPGELLLVDAIGLIAVSRETGRTTNEFRDWGVAALAVVGPRRYPPAGKRVHVAREGRRIVLPFNALSDRRWDLATATRDARLLALDLDGEDLLAWAGRVPAGDEDSLAMGPPLVQGARVWATVSRVALQTELSLACFALEDGRLLWETPLVRAVQVPRFASRQAKTSLDDLDKRAVETPPLAKDGRVWVDTGHGVVAVVDGLTGRLRLTFKYDRVPAQEAFQYEPAFLHDNAGWDQDVRARLYGEWVEPYALDRPLGWDDEPLRAWGDRIVVAPHDSRFLYVLADEPGPRGHLILDDPVEQMDRREIVALLPDPAGGASPATLCTRRSGRRSGLVLLAPGGAVRAASPWLDPGAVFTGRPVVVGGTAYVPTAVGLLGFDVSDLSAPPVRLPRAGPVPEGVAAVYALDDGLVTFSPSVNEESREAAWYVQWYRSSR